ncbi:MAG: hypothetical protein OXG64_07185 [Chloroflexi bacterium]|nr:hypothetical protein [Chloroflexota bacterium]
MVRNTTDSEYLLTHKTAEEYRSKGYEVLLEAPIDFMPGFTADLLVRKGDETRVIEVKSRPSLAANPKISELARLIESRPGWTFELVLVGEPEKVDSPEGARSFESEKIVQRIEEAEKSLDAGLPEAAFLLAWSASEAVIRELLAVQGVSKTTITSPGYVLDQGVYHGVISRADHDALTRMRKYRNAIVHGFGTEDFDGDMVKELIDTIRRITDF